MTLSITTPPSAEPVALADARAFLRVTSTAEDALIGALITAARTRIEAELGLAMLSTGFRESFDALPDGPIVLSRGPLTAAAAISVADSSGTFTALSAATYLPALGSRPGSITPVSGAWPTPGIAVDGARVDYTAGFGADPTEVPAPLVQAILRLVGYAYDHRSEPDPAPIALIEPWIAPYRRIRL
jgi:uncharacterized phiE125 gp8 family phage protein